MNLTRDHKRYIALILLVAILGLLLVVLATARGAGTSPDSVVYIGAARNLAAGQGLTEAFGNRQGKLLTRYPPLYPTALAVSGLGRSDALATGRWLNVLIFGGLILLVGGMLLATIPGRPWMAVLGSLLTLTALPLINTHVMVWSEPLFLLLGFSGLATLAAFLNSKRWWILVLSALLIALALLTRYAAAPFIFSGVLAILLLARLPLAKRILYLLLYGLISTLPSALWAYRNLALAGTATGRELAFHPIGSAQAWQALFTLSTWLHIPANAPTLVRIALIFSVVALIVFGILAGIRRGSGAEERQASDRNEAIPTLIWLILLFAITYVLFLVLSISFYDANTPLDDRILSPLYVAGIILTLFAASALLDLAGRRARILEIAVAASLLLFIAVSVLADVSPIRRYRESGIGFTRSAVQRSETIRQIENLPEDILIYSNAPEAIYLLTGRNAYPLPRPFLAITQRDNERYAEEVAEMEERIRNDGGALVYFSALSQKTSDTEALLRQLSLTPLSQTSDGVIYAESSQ